MAADCCSWEDIKMSKKATYILCVILFIILVALMICERQNPEAGVALLSGILG